MFYAEYGTTLAKEASAVDGTISDFITFQQIRCIIRLSVIMVEAEAFKLSQLSHSILFTGKNSSRWIKGHNSKFENFEGLTAFLIAIKTKSMAISEVLVCIAKYLCVQYCNLVRRKDTYSCMPKNLYIPTVELNIFKRDCHFL